MSSTSVPLSRTLLLTVTWCIAVVASSVGLNALIKSNQDKSRLKKLAPPPSVVEINTDSIYNAGIVATTASLLIAVILSKLIIAPYLPFTKSFAARTLRAQSIILGLASLFLLGSLIPFVVFFATGEADVKAFIGSVQLPDSAVKAVEANSGSTRVYKISDIKQNAVAVTEQEPSSPSKASMNEKETISENEKSSAV
ncbi:hypothetical protein JR316_0011849 [Psilocybe cubensis]|uniref:Uncharacterized protein n=1 Tax=Psilocybe cubensis TaxID=181762 RepID=A0ACB8GM38_PSICU|nr:hypothetical protein JR316_0011849 [Psilocybe cubensis]KAH9476276.1 hypothetical protein JR316_0011849 [Psilocybe cubensis]